MAAAFAVKKAFDPLDFVERWAGTVLCALVLLLGILLLCFIQYDIGGHRERIGLDATAYTRGLEFTIPLGLSIFLPSALWSMHFGGTAHAGHTSGGTARVSAEQAFVGGSGHACRLRQGAILGMTVSPTRANLLT